MTRFIIVSIVNGIIFGILDGIINANPFAQKMLDIYKPIARTSINIPAGIIIDLLYGFVLGTLFLLLYKSLPGETGVMKGISFALVVWFLRVLMYAISSWMMFKIPMQSIVYISAAGLAEMMILGVIYGIFLKPFKG